MKDVRMETAVYDALSPYAVGVDVGGTQINAAVVGEEGNVLYRIGLPTRAGQTDTGARVLEAIDRLLTEAAELFPHLRIRGIGIGTAGQVDWREGRIRLSSDLIPGYTGTPLKALVQEKFGCPAYVDNDVNVLAHTERRFGAAKDARHFICLALGTGVGGAIVSDGKLLHGAWGGAGELGHLSVNFAGPACVCGGRGCLEQYASGTAIGRRMRERLAAADEPHEAVDARDTIARWMAGDPVAAGVMRETAAALGTAIASLLHAFNPELVVIGGGVAEAGERLFTELREEVEYRAMPSFREGVRIVPAWQGNDSGMIGAAMQAWPET